MGSGVIFEEIECKNIINKASAPGMDFKWSANPYRGCQHACVYCFARRTHEFLGYDAGRDFQTRIIVKTNAAQVLREQLRRPSWKGELIVLGTACDPYQQAELKYEITRKMLKVFVDFSQPVHTLTKSPGVLRDLDLWVRLAELTDVQVRIQRADARRSRLEEDRTANGKAGEAPGGDAPPGRGRRPLRRHAGAGHPRRNRHEGEHGICLPGGARKWRDVRLAERPLPQARNEGMVHAGPARGLPSP